MQLVRAARAHGAVLIYDIIDDWNDPQLSWWTYRADVEREFVQTADHVLVTMESLKPSLATSASIHLVPNAYDNERFYEDPSIDVPDELVELITRPIVMYAGALWGHWMDSTRRP